MTGMLSEALVVDEAGEKLSAALVLPQFEEQFGIQHPFVHVEIVSIGPKRLNALVEVGKVQSNLLHLSAPIGVTRCSRLPHHFR